MFQFWNVYQRESNGNLLLINPEFLARDKSDATSRWHELYGDNYGKVVIIRHDSTLRHQAYSN